MPASRPDVLARSIAAVLAEGKTWKRSSLGPSPTDADVLHEIGKRVQSSREERGISQAHAAFAIAITPEDWAAYEQGEKEPEGHHGLAMAVLFAVDPWWLSVGP